ncbi:hypothetical protein JTB14_024754 [Gonioctena quinquepunctata]|nr:hypothetical protein JTB14_024754 [Gonioctena quinquepunctata]
MLVGRIMQRAMQSTEGSINGVQTSSKRKGIYNYKETAAEMRKLTKRKQFTPPSIPENNNRIADTNQGQSPLSSVEELMVEIEKKKNGTRNRPDKLLHD